jgi:palmitoyltransferase ZDHHC1/11
VNSTSRYCNYCQSPVISLNTKHCLRCNRCTLEFDHHCKYVNNCIGSLNYKNFSRLLVSIQIYEAFTTVSLVFYLTNKSSSITKLDSLVLLALLKSFVIFCLNGYLIFFHIYLKIKKITTYDYIINKRKIKSNVKPSRNLSETNFNF